MLFSTIWPLCADEFDTLRLNWRDMLTMGTNANPVDPMYSGWISNIASTAQSFWNKMAVNTGRTYLWSDLNHLATNSGDITASYGRLKAMTLGWAVHGSALESNVSLRNAITN